MQALSFERSRFAETAVVSLLTLASLALFGWVLAYWTWMWLAPRPEPRAQAAAEPDARADSAYGLFRSVRRDGTVAAPTGIAIKLLGVVASSRGQSAYAIVQLEPRQIRAVRGGEDIAPGIRLAEVDADHVVLERNGARETLAWPDRNTTTESAAPPIAQKRN